MEDYYCEGQMSLFNIPRFKIDKPIRLIELFAGIGSQAMALERIGADFETYRVVEFDKYAIMSYNAIHGTDFPTMDITQVKGQDLGIVDTDKYCYIMTYSFPCQDLSVSGLGRGMAKGSGTRSGLLWEVERLLNETENLPQVLLMENVPQVHAEKNWEDWQKWLDFLHGKGYMNYWKDLNAKEIGWDKPIPQNRDRCFMVSILGNYDYKFPRPQQLNECIKDYLEDEVDEKYYINSERADKLLEKLVADGVLPSQGGQRTTTDMSLKNPMGKEVANTITTKENRGISNQGPSSTAVCEVGYIEKGTGKHQTNTIYGKEGLCPTVPAVSYKEPIKIV